MGEEPCLSSGNIVSSFKAVESLSLSTNYFRSIAYTYEPLSFGTPSKRHSRSAYCAYKLPECYLSPTPLALSTLWSSYIQYDGNLSDREPRQLIQVHTHISETDSGSITSLKVQLNFQSNYNFRPCRCV